MKDGHSERPSMSPLINRDLQNNSEFNDYAQNLLRIQRNNMSPRLFFNAIKIRNKNVYFHGAVLAFFTISVIYTFVIGCQGFSQLANYHGSLNNTSLDYYSSGDINDNDPTNLGLRLLEFQHRTLATKSPSSNSSNQTNSSLGNSTASNGTSNSTSTPQNPYVSFNIFTYTLPFVAFILDHSSKRLMNLPEKTIFLMIKLAIIVYYLGSYVLALQSPDVTSSYYIVANVNFVVFPVLTVTYAYLLRKKKLG